MNAPLVLASTSRYRAALLARLGVAFEQVAPSVDERALEADGLDPHRLAETLAEAKAAAVAASRPEAIVIGSDQVCALGSEVLHKPGSEARAREMLAKLSGRRHQLITAVAVHGPRGRERHTDVAELAMRALEADAIARYVAADQPLDCAGSYKLEALGVALFDAVRCEDHSAITGLPMLATVRLLRAQGLSLP
ncbi:MAG: Maf family nucleotide pyrophosphatase [Planctomycetota bacterium]